MKYLGNQLILVCDPKTIEILDYALTNLELSDLGIAVIQNILLKRRKIKLNAIYFLSTETESLKSLVDDFCRKKLQYLTPLFLFFISKIDGLIKEKLVQTDIISNLTILSEIPIGFKYLEDFCFTCGPTKTFPILFRFDGNRCSTKKKQFLENIRFKIINNIAVQLEAVLFNLNRIQHFFFMSYGKISKELEIKIKPRLKKRLYFSKNKMFIDRISKCYITMIDRSFDPATPFFHNYGYQALIYDFFTNKNEIIRKSTGFTYKKFKQIKIPISWKNKEVINWLQDLGEH